MVLLGMGVMTEGFGHAIRGGLYNFNGCYKGLGLRGLRGVGFRDARVAWISIGAATVAIGGARVSRVVGGG